MLLVLIPGRVRDRLRSLIEFSIIMPFFRLRPPSSTPPLLLQIQLHLSLHIRKASYTYSLQHTAISHRPYLIDNMVTQKLTPLIANNNPRNKISSSKIANTINTNATNNDPLVAIIRNITFRAAS